MATLDARLARLSTDKLLRDIEDLIKQATTEQSHYYTASVLLRAKAEIERLRRDDGKDGGRCAR